MKVKFLKSAADLKGWPAEGKPEIALVGRSNVGKSSILNIISNNIIAKVSASPGKTRLINFFDVGEKYKIVDLPGYGYAAVGAKEANSWVKMISDYINHRQSLLGIILIMDVRRDFRKEEQMILDWMSEISKPVYLVLNKSDKLNKRDIEKAKKNAKIQNVEAVYVTSTKNPKSILDLEKQIFNDLIKEEN